MIRELINFTNNLDEEFKNLGSSPKEGLHVLLKIEADEDRLTSINTQDYQFEQYSKKEKKYPSDFLNYCKLLQQNSWMIDTNKCFDNITRAIHTSSAFSVAIKKDNLIGGKNYMLRKKDGKKLVYYSFDNYFNKAFSLLKEESEKYVVFRDFFTHNFFSQVLSKIESEFSDEFQKIEIDLNALKELQKETKDKTEKELLKGKITALEQQLLKVKPLDDSSYVIFYLDLPLDKYQEVHKKYLDDKLFNTDKYNTKPDENGLIYGTNNFMNGFNGDMPFLIHQTAAFDITGRISNLEAKTLNDLKNLLSNRTRTLPNPLPLFIYRDELMQDEIIKIFKNSEFKFGYKEIVQEILKKEDAALSNYYLLYWHNSKDGIVFKDFDYVSKFEYKIEKLIIQNLFEIKEKGGKTDKHYNRIDTIFDLEQQVLKPLIQSKYLRVDFFGDLNKDEYAKLDRTFESFSKYRKAVYDFVYKSQRQNIDGNAFHEMVFNSILDDLKNGNDYGVKEKLNIWYSLYEYFNPINKINMVNKLKEYQAFVAAIIAGEEVTDITDEKFAFAAGQTIEYILSKSKSADNSHNLLEPYLQQSKCSEFKKAIANDFGRYKHENFSNNFEKVAAFVLSYETDANLKHLLPQILSGVFAKNLLFSSTKSN